MRSIYQQVILIALCAYGCSCWIVFSLLLLLKVTLLQSASYRALSLTFYKLMAAFFYFPLQHVPSRCGFRN